MRSVLLMCALFIALTFNSIAQQVQLVQQQDVASTIRLLELWIESEMAYRNIPGLAIGIVYDQDLIWSKGFGYANLATNTPMTPATLFRMASITKLFTSTAIMQLRDMGKLHLDDPVVTYLPWFTFKNRFPDAPQITIRHLLNHTSGLPRESAFPYWTDHNFPTRDQMIAALAQQENSFEPQTKFNYSNLGMAILGEVVAAASGVPYELYVRQNILGPLEMKNTFVTLRPEEKQRLATGYDRRMPDGTRKVSSFVDAKGLTSAANIASTVEDMARFASLQFREGKAGGNQILRGSTLREMRLVQWLQPSWKSGWGLGFSISKTDERVTFGHGGWVGGFRSQLLMSASEKVAVIVMVNADDRTPDLFAGRALSMLAPVIAKATSPAPKSVQADSSWATYIGRYTDLTGWDTEVLVVAGRLVLYDHNYPPEENPSGVLTELTPEGKDTFQMKESNNELVVFESGPTGKIFRVKVGENYMYPAGSQ